MKLRLHIAQPILAALSVFVSGLTAQTTHVPSAKISNGQISVNVLLPNAENGFYRSTRFDWSGVIDSLTYKGHDFYGRWFSRTDAAPEFYDFNYDESGVVSAPFTAMVGPGEEFNTDRTALGWAEAEPGGTFVKIGVGILKKPDDSKYDHSKQYEIVDGGKWSVKHTASSIEFTHQLHDPASGYGYVYTKTIRLIPGKPEMLIEHRLKNTGSKVIDTTVYDHNFWTLDHLAPGPGLSLRFPFQIQTTRPPNPEFAKIEGNRFVYIKELTGKDRVTAALKGYGPSASDYEIYEEDSKAGAGVHITGDRPITNLALWSIRTVMAIEPYISMKIEPGSDSTWKLTYDYYTLDKETTTGKKMD